MEKVDDLFLQVRTAHRLLAAYYQRLVPAIGDIAHKLGLTFLYWGNTEFGHTPATHRDVTRNWKWDLLPGMTTYYLYGSFITGGKVEVGEYLVEIVTVSDSGIDSYGKGRANEPDPLNLSLSVEEAKSLLRVTVCAPFLPIENNYFATWQRCSYPTFTSEPEPQKDSNGQSCILSGFEVPLSDLVAENGTTEIVEKIRQFILSTVSAAQDEYVNRA